MTDETKSGLDAIDEGPVSSDVGEIPESGAVGSDADHPSVAAMREKFGDVVLRHEIQGGDEHVVFVEAASAHEIVAWLKDDEDQDYKFCTDVTCVDFGGGAPLQVVYQLFSFTHHYTLRVKAELPLDALEIKSVADLYRTADWLEREVYDLFGIIFTGHPDLRRILMPHDSAEGHPLRKDFPLRGRFSRAEQTRRALMQEPEHFYFPGEMGGGRKPQHLVEPEIGTHAEDQG